MTQQEYLVAFKELCEKEIALTTRKNADYADSNNAFANFEIITHLSSGRISPEEGFVVRMSDKLQRIVNLISRPNQVADEKIEDTLFDLAVYCKLFQCFLKDKHGKTRDVETAGRIREAT